MRLYEDGIKNSLRGEVIDRHLLSVHRKKFLVIEEISPPMFLMVRGLPSIGEKWLMSQMHVCFYEFSSLK